MATVAAVMQANGASTKNRVCFLDPKMRFMATASAPNVRTQAVPVIRYVYDPQAIDVIEIDFNSQVCMQGQCLSANVDCGSGAQGDSCPTGDGWRCIGATTFTTGFCSYFGAMRFTDSKASL